MNKIDSKAAVGKAEQDLAPLLQTRQVERPVGEETRAFLADFAISLWLLRQEPAALPKAA